MTTIITKNSSTAGAAPTAGDLVQGELAVNVTDKALYTENASGTVVKLNTPSIVDNGNATAITIDSSENVGVGVTPSANSLTSGSFDLKNGVGLFGYNNGFNLSANAYYDTAWKYKATAAATLYIQSTGQHIWSTAASGTAGNAISFTQAMTLNASGQLLVNTTSSPSSSTVKAAINGSSGADAYYQFTNGSGGGGSIGSDGGAGINFYTLTGAVGSESATYRAKIDSSGNLLVGATSPIGSGKQTISYVGSSYNGIVLSESANTANTAYAVFANGSTAIGSVVRVGSTSAVVYNTTSDQRLKSNIEDAVPVLDKLMSVKVRQYDWTDGDLHQDYGFIAQELEPVLSGIVTKGKTEEDVWQLDYSRLTPHLVKAIQELKAELDSNKREFDAYKATHP